MKTIANLYFLNKIPFIRVDLNVPKNNLLRYLDNDRIIETIAHGEISNKSSFINIIPYLQKALKIQVDFYIEIIGNKIHRKLFFFGLLMYKEFRALRYFVFFGTKRAKVSSKIDLLVNILPLIDHLLIAGGMAYTFIKVLEGRIGNSLLEFYKTFQKFHVYLPIDVIIADNMNKEANIKEQFAIKNHINWMGLDIRRKSIYEFIKVINRSLSIFWNGPLVVNFSNRTLSIINTIKNVNSKGAFSMVGGGDSLLSRKKNKDKISYISTGAGAMLALALLKGKIISGVAIYC